MPLNRHIKKISIQKVWLFPLRHKYLQQESHEVWEGVEFAIESDILISQFDTVFNVWIFSSFSSLFNDAVALSLAFTSTGIRELASRTKKSISREGLSQL